jgi:uncharacterized protein YndB with AHSA1/START domain
VKLVVQELPVAAPPAVLYELLVDPVRFLEWMADAAVLEPVPGGVIEWTMANGDRCAGRYVELVPDRRVVFTYGWERADVGIPPGSTTVEIDLVARPDGTTLVKLVHRGLDPPAADAHHGGWMHYLDRLGRAAEGAPPGPDPWVTERVPTAEERARARPAGG